MPAVTSIAIGAAIAGTALSAYSGIKSANDQANAAENQAALNDLEAEETIRRARVRDSWMIADEQKMTHSVVGAYSKAGLTLEGTPLTTIESNIAQMERERAEAWQEAWFRAEQLRRGSTLQQEAAGDIRTAGWLSTSGGVLSSGASIASKYFPSKGTQSWNDFNGKPVATDFNGKTGGTRYA